MRILSKANVKRLTGLYLISFLLAMPQTVFALSSAEEIKSKKWGSSGELLEGILEIQDGIGSLRSYPEFLSYFELLPLLETKAQEFQLDSIYPGVVEQLADRLAGHGMRWVKISDTPIIEVKNLMKVMSASTMVRFLDNLESEIDNLDETAEEKLIGSKLAEVSKYISKTYPSNLNIQRKIDLLTSSLSEKVLVNNPEISGKDYVFWLSGLKEVRYVENYLLFLYSQVLLASPENLDLLTFQVLQTGAHLKRQDSLPTGVSNVYGDIFVEFLGAAMESATVLDEKGLEESLSQLSTVYLQGVVYRLIDARKMPPSEYIDSYLKSIRLVATELHKRGLAYIAEDLTEKIETRMAAAIATAQGHEGTYKLKDGEGNNWILTLVRSTEDRLVAALGLKEGMLYQSLFNITYSIEEKKYLASDFVPDDNPFPNFITEFEISKDGKIKMDLPFSPEVDRRELIGERTQSYPDYFSMKNLDADYITGEYRGEISLPSGRVQKVTLFVKNFKEYSVGRLSFDDQLTLVELQHGTQGGEGYIYLTSGQSRARSFVHLRLKQDPENGFLLNGIVVVGGQGMGSSVSLEKVE